MAKKPDAYKMKARSRAGIVAEIVKLTEHRMCFNDPYYLCFNVKVYESVDLSLPTLLNLWRNYEGDNLHTHNAEWLREVKEKFEEIGDQKLFDWGIEECRSSYIGRYHSGIPESDAVRTLWNGTELNVKYNFVGRSGGWLAIAEFEGLQLDRPQGDLENILNDTDFGTLQNLYQLVLQIKHDTRTEAILSEIAHQAAFQFFANACADITQPDTIQPHLFDNELETEEAILT